MTSFQNRAPVKVALIGLVTLALLTLGAYNTDKLPLLGGGTGYRAELANAAGIRAGNPVKIAGVVVGRVDDVTLEGDTVEISFTIDDAWVGEQSTASVQLNTLLGQRYLAVAPSGDEELDADGVIPLERTTTPYDIIPAINDLSRTVGEIDVDQLSRSLDTVADTFAGTPGAVPGALDGLTRLSTTISKRDAALRQLLDRAGTVTGTIASRDQEVERLLGDINPLLAEIQFRRDAIRQLLDGTRALSRELTGLVADNTDTLRPALERLARVADVLERNRDELDAGIKAIGPYVHLFSNTVGSGRWFDAYVCGLLPLPLAGTNPEGCEAS